MNGRYTFLMVGAFLLTLGAPAIAGQPDNPQEKRDKVQMNLDYQQAIGGASGFGKRISMRATTSNARDRFRNFGDYLQQTTSGPNLANDSGGGND